MVFVYYICNVTFICMNDRKLSKYWIQQKDEKKPLTKFKNIKCWMPKSQVNNFLNKSLVSFKLSMCLFFIIRYIIPGWKKMPPLSVFVWFYSVIHIPCIKCIMYCIESFQQFQRLSASLSTIIPMCVLLWNMAYYYTFIWLQIVPYTYHRETHDQVKSVEIWIDGFEFIKNVKTGIFPMIIAWLDYVKFDILYIGFSLFILIRYVEFYSCDSIGIYIWIGKAF